MTNSSHALVLIQLDVLTAVLEQHGLWSTRPPTPEALASQQPFACDTLRFEQWLQFIFVPRMQALIEAGSPLPRHMQVAPMAEETLPSYPEVIAILHKLDNAVRQ